VLKLNRLADRGGRVLETVDAVAPLRRAVSLFSANPVGHLEGMADHFEGIVKRQLTVGKFASAWNSYCRTCDATNTERLPITIRKIEGWLLIYVLFEGKSSKSASGLMSRLVRTAGALGHEVESLPAQRKRDFIMALRKSDPAPATKRALAFPEDCLHLLYEKFIKPDGPTNRQLQVYVAMSLTCTMGFRMGELIQGRFRACDIRILEPQAGKTPRSHYRRENPIEKLIR
jgi:hypothetical protein